MVLVVCCVISAYANPALNNSLTRSKRSNDAGYDKTYDKFISRNFPTAKSGYIDNGKSQRQTQDEESEEDESEEEQDTDVYENNQEYERIKAVSEDHAKKLSKKTANCEEYLQNGMICKSCKDPNTGDTSESCNYSSDPVDKKVAFTKSKNYAYDRHPLTDENEQEEPEEEVVVVSEPPKEELVTPSIKKKPLKRNYPRKVKKTRRLAKPKQQLQPEHREIDEANDYGAYKLADFNEDVADYDQPRSAPLKVYPGDSPVDNPQDQENINTEYEILPQSEFNENNFEKVLSEFKKKDFSNCKKTTKGELTCYVCKDRAGLKQEECMFVSQTNPKNKKISFTESKSFGKALKKRPATTTEAPQAQYQEAPQIPQNQQNYQQSFGQRAPAARYQRTRKPRVLAPTTSIPQVTFDHLSPIVAQDQIQRRTVKIKRKVLVDNKTPVMCNNHPTCYESHVLHKN